jgi:hypothetical protein
LNENKIILKLETVLEIRGVLEGVRKALASQI